MWKVVLKDESEALTQTAACRYRDEEWKTYIRTATLWAHIRTRNTPKTEMEYQVLRHNIWSLYSLISGFLEWENKIKELGIDDDY